MERKKNSVKCHWNQHHLIISVSTKTQTQNVITGNVDTTWCAGWRTSLDWVTSSKYGPRGGIAWKSVKGCIEVKPSPWPTYGLFKGVQTRTMSGGTGLCFLRSLNVVGQAVRGISDYVCLCMRVCFFRLRGMLWLSGGYRGAWGLVCAWFILILFFIWFLTCFITLVDNHPLPP